MIAKLIVLRTDRDQARRRMLRALDEFEIEGVHSLIPIHQAILEHPDSSPAGTLREFVEGGGYAAALAERDGAGATPASAPAAERTRRARVVAEVDGRRFEVTVSRARASRPHAAARRRAAMAERERRGSTGRRTSSRSPMQGTVLRVGVAAGDGSRPASCWWSSRR